MGNTTENGSQTAASDLTRGPLAKQILIFSLPLMASNIMQVLFNMADVAVVGRFAGSDALGSVGSTTTLVALYTGVLIGLSSGINVLVALAVGAGDRRSVEETVHTALLLSGMIGVLLMVAGVSSADGILRLLHTKPELLAGAVSYLHIYLLGLPALALYNFGNAVLSAAGDTKRPLLYLSVAGVLNVALNLFFVLVCHLAVVGVALASIISQYVSAFLILRHLLVCGESYGLRRELLRVNRERAVRILQLGVPAGLQNAIFYVANLFVQMGVNSFDAVMVAGNSAAANADNLVYDMMAAFYTACGSFIGQNYGAKQKKRVLKSFFFSMFYAFILALVLGVGLVVCGRRFLSLFSPDSAVIAAGMVRLRIMGLSYCVSAFMDCAIAAARSLGKSLVPTVTVIMGACVFRVVWIYTVFAHFGTPESLYLLFVCSWTITAIVGNLYFARVYGEAVKGW
ncbi:MAG: MATE family efflux transporter [Butyrivibrio sp.]|nr:MATE family efflux transporter [Muribaculum sp.]MCM1553086.1 MATE family efflux transporter [Butyrivibrio sp.]